jgi:uncharacterized RDD family membrane protein YckC
MKVTSNNGGPITWALALKRFVTAWLSLLCLGLGFLWVLYDRDKLAWHDRLSGTKLIQLPKRQA